MLQSPSPSQSPESEPDADLALLKCILTDAKSGRLQLPSLPDVAQQVRTAMNDPERSVADIARIVQFDPALAARLIQIANSPLYRGANKFDNCHIAIARLGLKATRNLVTSFTVRNLFQSQSTQLRDRLQHTWQHSCRVAAISSVLARLTPGLDPDRALLAGLVHDIGALPLLKYIETMQLKFEPGRIDDLLARLCAALGTFVLKTWQFEEDLARVPGQVEDWSRDSGARVDYGDVVQVAHVHSQFGQAGGYRGPALPELRSYQKLTISRLGPGCSIELLEQSQHEIDEVLNILQS